MYYSHTMNLYQLSTRRTLLGLYPTCDLGGLDMLSNYSYFAPGFEYGPHNHQDFLDV